MNTTSPQIGLPAGLSRAVAPEGAIMPKNYIEKVGEEEFRKKPIGSGPWKFVRNVPGDRIEFTAVTTPHWRGRPHFKDLHDPAGAGGEHARGHGAHRRGGDRLDRARRPCSAPRAPGWRCWRCPAPCRRSSSSGAPASRSVKDSPIAKPRVRQALSLAIDRKQVIEHVMNGKAQHAAIRSRPSATPTIFSADRWKKWADEAYRYDPALAKKILAEEGYPNGFELKFANTALPGTQFMVDIGTAIADMWTKIGVKVTLKHYEWGAVRADGARRPGRARSAGPRCTARPAGPTRRGATTAPSRPRAPQRLLGDKDNCHEACQEFVKTYKRAARRARPGKRTALNDHMVELVANSWTVVPIIEGMGYYAINTKKVGQFEAIPGRHELGDVFERIPRPEQKPWKK